MKAALLLGAILLMSLVMANEDGKSEGKGEQKEKPKNQTDSLPKLGAGTMVREGLVFFLLPLMWMVVHLLHM